MNEKDIIFLEQLLSNKDKDYVVSQLKTIDNPLLLHYFAANYNWDSGFDIPTAILENEACDLGTGLLMFHYADGYCLLENLNEISSSSIDEWNVFFDKDLL